MILDVPGTIVITKTATATVKVGCPKDVVGVCSGTLSLLSSRGTRLALSAFSGLKPNAFVLVKLKFPATSLKQLLPNKVMSLTLSAYATATGAGFDVTEKKVSVKYVTATNKRPPVMIFKTPSTIVIPKTAIAAVSLGCPATIQGVCSGTLTLLGTKGTRLAASAFKGLKPRAIVAVKLKLSPTSLKQLPANKVVQLTLSAYANATGTGFARTQKKVSVKYVPTLAGTPEKKPPKTSITITIPK